MESVEVGEGDEDLFGIEEDSSDEVAVGDIELCWIGRGGYDSPSGVVEMNHCSVSGSFQFDRVFDVDLFLNPVLGSFCIFPDVDCFSAQAYAYSCCTGGRLLALQ